jgi:hypothetical protein
MVDHGEHRWVGVACCSGERASDAQQDVSHSGTTLSLTFPPPSTTHLQRQPPAAAWRRPTSPPRRWARAGSRPSNTVIQSSRVHTAELANQLKSALTQHDKQSEPTGLGTLPTGWQRPAERQTHTETDRQTYRPTDGQIDRLTVTQKPDRQTDIQTYRQTDRQTYTHTDRQTDRHALKMQLTSFFARKHVHNHTHLRRVKQRLRHIGSAREDERRVAIVVGPAHQLHLLLH